MNKVLISNILYIIAIILVVVYIYLKSQGNTISEIYFAALGSFAVGFVLRIMERQKRNDE